MARPHLARLGSLFHGPAGLNIRQETQHCLVERLQLRDRRAVGRTPDEETLPPIDASGRRQNSNCWRRRNTSATSAVATERVFCYPVDRAGQVWNDGRSAPAT